MLNTPGDSGLKVPSANENEYCHFCFSSENLLLLFPFEQYIRPDMTSFIDTFIGVQLSSENDTNFTLCRSCIDAIAFCIAFRECCRKHHEAVRESRHFHRVMEHLHSFLQESVLEDVSTTVALETTTINHQAPTITSEDATFEQCVPSPVTADIPSTPTVECPRQKRRQPESSGIGSHVQQSKKMKHTEERLQGKGNHIRVLMRRASVKSRPEVNTETSPAACVDVAENLGSEVNVETSPEACLPAVPAAENLGSEVNVETYPEACLPAAPAAVILRSEVNGEISPEACLQTATAAVNLRSEVTAETSHETCLQTGNAAVNLGSEVNAETSPEACLQTVTAAVKISSEVNPDTSAEPCLKTANPLLNSTTDTRPELGEVNSEFSNKPAVCKPCFVAVKKLDVSLLTL